MLKVLRFWGQCSRKVSSRPNILPSIFFKTDHIIQKAFSTASTFTPHTNIAIVGLMNAGKSTLINRLTQSEASIVDSTPGTTADTKVVNCELHRIGPCKVFDTAGIDEKGSLGQKKREKVIAVVKESDLILWVVGDLRAPVSSHERDLLQIAKNRNKVIAIISNTYEAKQQRITETKSATPTSLSTPTDSIKRLQETEQIPYIEFDLNTKKNNDQLVAFIENVVRPNMVENDLIPRKYLGRDSCVFLNIPMDAETPHGRLLRPQSRLQEFCLSNFTSTYAYRMDLAKARSANPADVTEEQQRFWKAVTNASPRLIVTDSQAMDVVYPWLSHDGFSAIDLTTFSIIMMNDTSGGKLSTFVKGLEKFSQLKRGDKVLIAEACNHNRITDVCEDIGTSQIPKKIEKLHGKEVYIDHAFGREFPSEKLKEYSVVIHCGGCMIDKQKIVARMEDCEEIGVAMTNYGLLLSHFQSPAAVERVIKPWKTIEVQ